MKNFNFGLVGIIIGVILFIMSVIIFSASRDSRAPFFAIDNNRNQLLDPKNVNLTSGIKIFKNDSVEILSTVNSLRFYFWNNGKLSIKPENIIQDIEFSFKDTTVEIIDYKILKKSREVINFRINQLNNYKLGLKDFNIFDFQDGFSCQLIYEGGIKSEFNISGTIEGAIKFSDVSSIKNKLYRFPLILFGILLIPVLYEVGTIHNKKYWKLENKEGDKESKHESQYTPMSTRIGCTVIIFLFAIAFSYWQYHGKKRDFEKEPFNLVPKELIGN